MINATNLSLTYGKRQALQNISFSIPTGITALLGSNGAGKSSLVDVLTTVCKPASGSVTFQGETVVGPATTRSARKKYLQQLGVLHQTLGYSPHFTVTQFLTYSGWLRGLTANQARSYAPEALERVGLGGRATSRMRDLSGGMVRRVGIAASILGNPKVIIFDEPTTGLDVEQRAAFRDIIANLPEETAVLLCTHIASDITDTCNNVIVLSAGSIAFQGTLRRLHDLAPAGTPDHLSTEQGYLQAISSQGVPA